MKSFNVLIICYINQMFKKIQKKIISGYFYLNPTLNVCDIK